MRNYIAFYKNRTLEVQATSSYEAQQIASRLFKAKKSYEVTVMLSDTIHHPATI